MNIASTIPLPSEKLIAVAESWSELFCKTKPDKKQLFVDHFLSRATVRRFWSDVGDIKGKRIAACRLGDSVMLIYYQGLIHKLPIKGNRSLGFNIPNGGIGPTKHMVRFLEGIQRKIDEGIKLEYQALDALTSFSGQATREVDDVLQSDIPEFLRIRLKEKKNRYAGFYSVNKKKYMGRYGNALKHFLGQVDPKILFAVRSLRCPSIALYNWLSSGDAKRRMQAARAYPVLVPLEVVLWRGGASAELTDLSNLVDQGKSITSFFAGVYETSDSVMKKIGKLSPYLIGSAITFLKYRFDRDDFLRTIKAFQLGSKRPQTAKGWKTCDMVMSSTDIKFNESNLAGMPPWESPEWSQLHHEMRSLYDIGLSRTVISRHSVKKTLAFSNEWHEHRAKVQTSLLETGNYETSSWPGMLKDGIVHPETGLSFVEIVDDIALAYEGELMGHCVGGYSGYCFDGASRIVSIRDGKKPLVTIEYRLETSKGGRRSFTCSQAQGPGNKPFNGTPADKAFRWFTKNFRSFVKTYDIQPVPWNLRPSGKADLGNDVRKQMQVWANLKIEQMGYTDELKKLDEQLRQKDHFFDEEDYHY